MMRIWMYILFLAFFAFSCVKKQSTSPIPVIEFKDFQYSTKPTVPVPSDLGTLTISYADGDGDIFRDVNHTVPNLIIITYHKDTISGNFYQDSTTIPMGPKIAIHTDLAVYQPGDGYAGKAVKGDIIVPYNEFRISRAIKIIKHTVFVVDEAGHKSNVVTSPIYTLTI